jgi:hypothetical protein
MAGREARAEDRGDRLGQRGIDHARAAVADHSQAARGASPALTAVVETAYLQVLRACAIVFVMAQAGVLLDAGIRGAAHAHDR